MIYDIYINDIYIYIYIYIYINTINQEQRLGKQQ